MKTASIGSSIGFLRTMGCMLMIICGFSILAAAQTTAPSQEPGMVDKTKEAVGDAVDKTKEFAGNAVDKTKEVASEAVDKTKETAAAANDKLADMWRTMDEKRLTHRTNDEIVAWVIMGVLVGSIAGLFTNLKNTGFGWFARIVLGLAGAFIGGIFVHLTQINFGLGPVMIRYEDLLFALVGAVLLVVLAKLVGGMLSGKKKSKKE